MYDIKNYAEIKKHQGQLKTLQLNSTTYLGYSHSKKNIILATIMLSITIYNIYNIYI